MKRLLLILSVLTVAACATAGAISTRVAGTDREKLIQIATKELLRRHLRLPSQYDVRVGDGVIGNELEPNRGVWIVHFNFIYRGKKSAVYKVFIDKRSGGIDHVFDSRRMIPSGI